MHTYVHDTLKDSYVYTAYSGYVANISKSGIVEDHILGQYALAFHQLWLAKQTNESMAHTYAHQIMTGFE